MHLDETATDTAAWNDLERDFFDSAPPDEPEPSTEPSSFDDLQEIPVRRRRKPPPIAAIVLAAMALLVGLGLSAAVLAAH